MGTHTYSLEVFRRTKEEKQPTPNSLGFHRFASSATGDFSDITIVDENRHIDDTRYMDVFPCRELLLNDSGIWSDVFYIPEHNYMMGIRCNGEMYHNTYRLLRRDKNSKIKVKKVLEDVFGISLDIRYGTLEKRIAERTFGGFSIVYGDGEKESLGYVTLYLNSWENQGICAIDAGVSAILALLREPIIIRGILSGDIFDTQSLCKVLIKISLARAKETDDSYNCLRLLGIMDSTTRTMSELRQQIRRNLSEENNDDGSDWFSMATLAVFCFIFKTLIGYGVETGTAGPCDFIVENANLDHFIDFKYFVDEPETIKSLVSFIPDLTDDEYREALFCEERMVKAWESA